MRANTNKYVRLGLLPRGKSRCLFVSDESGVKRKGEKKNDEKKEE
jgi:hypothetical protein